MSTKQAKNKVKDTSVMLGEDTKDVGYDRYKKICYGKLILKALLFFFLGLVTSYLLLD